MDGGRIFSEPTLNETTGSYRILTSGGATNNLLVHVRMESAYGHPELNAVYSTWLRMSSVQATNMGR